VHKRGPQSGKS